MADLADEFGRSLIVPVFLGSAENGSGVRRLLKALRHETPELKVAAERIGAEGKSAAVIKTRHVGQAGRHVAVWEGTSRGSPAGPGVYFARLSSGVESRTTRFVRVQP